MNILPALAVHPLFKGFKEDELKYIMESFSFIHRNINKDEYILLEGDCVHSIGLILSGSIIMEKVDYEGNHYIFNELEETELFAEPFIGTYIQNSSVNYKAKTPCSILLFHYKPLFTPSLQYYNCYVHFTENLMYLLAIKTRSLLTKIEILSQKDIQKRILSFLHALQTRQILHDYTPHSPNSNTNQLNEIIVPFNRTEMANYLCVNRSALVRTLSQMKKENIITFNKNTFLLLT